MRLLTETMLGNCGVQRGDAVLVALSGGGDSVALCHGAFLLKESGYLGDVFAAHVHHGIRGESADNDAAFCEKFCRERGIPFFIGRVDALGEAGKKGVSLELAARRLRYAFLREAAKKAGAGCIVTAHHRDDQAETLLLHLLRGCGTGGLAAMAFRSGDVARPLLDIRRAQIEAYLAEEGLAYRTDETNFQLDATRNRVRHMLLPAMRELNPNVVEALVRAAEIAGADDAYLTGLADEALARAKACGGYGRQTLASLPVPVRARAVKRVLTGLSDDVTNADIRRVGDLLNAQTGTCIELRQGRAAWVDHERLYVGTAPERVCYEVPFALEGETVLPTGARLVARRVERFIKPVDGSVAYVDLDRLPKGITVRTRHDGDRFHPFGAPGERKLSDYFIDKKTPRAKRDVPMLACGGTVYCVFFHTVSQLVAVGPGTQNILQIKYKGERDT